MHEPRGAGPGPRTRAFVAWAIRHGRLLWVLAVLLAVPATIRMVRLYMHLNSELDALLPPKAPSVVAIQELRARMPGLQYLGVIVDTGDATKLPAGEKLLDDLGAKIATYPKDLVRSVRTGVKEERAFLEKNAPLYVELPDLVTIRSRLEARKEWEAGKAMGVSLDDTDPAPSVDFSDLEKKYQDKSGDRGRFPDDRFSSKELHVSLLLVEVGSFSTGAGAAELLARVQADLASLGGPEKYGPGLKVGYTGDVAVNVEELSALVTDLGVSSILVVVAVLAVLLIFFRWWRSLPLLFLPLLLATICTFGLVTLPPFRINELNSNTAFLGSIIVGNGINFGIVLVARYVEARRAGASVDDALVTSSWGARVGTLSAALAAGVAYGSLMITGFRGFRQFGIIGAIGMVLAWSFAFVLTPSLTRVLDRDATTAPRKRPEGAGLMALVARFVRRFPVPITVFALVVTAAAGFAVRKLDRSRLETDFSRLRRADTFVRGEGFWGRKMDALLGRYLSPTVILTDKPEDARKVERSLREAVKVAPLSDIASSVVGVDDVLPREQEEKLAEVKKIKAVLTPRVLASLDDKQKKVVDRFLGHDLVALRPLDLPGTFSAGLREKDGTMDKAVLFYPRPSELLWKGEALSALSRALRDAAKKDIAGPPPRVAGSLVLSSDIVESISRDGVVATITALTGVILVVLLLFRRSLSSVYVIGSLCVGVLWLAAATLAMGVKINFANFIAFPITFGIGVDYAVNVVARWDQDGRGDVSGAIVSTGGAVGLCSMTTIIGYSSLLLAENRALFSFGLVAVLGEVCCLFTAVVALPAVLLALGKKAT